MSECFLWNAPWSLPIYFICYYDKITVFHQTQKNTTTTKTMRYRHYISAISQPGLCISALAIKEPISVHHDSVVAKHCRENIRTTWKWLDKRPACPRTESSYQVTVPPPQFDWQMLLSTRQLKHNKSCPLLTLQFQERWWHFQLITNHFLTYGIYSISYHSNL